MQQRLVQAGYQGLVFHLLRSRYSMTISQSLVLGIVQGLTEFLPVSSTAHLRILPYFLGWEDPGAAFSAAIQLGTLAAVFIYFAGDIKRLVSAAWEGLCRRDLRNTQDSLLAWAIIPGTLPIAVLGLGFRDFIESEAREITIVAVALMALGILLLVAEKAGKRNRGMDGLRFWHIQFIGFCQALALIPGSSRSGATIMGGLLVGLRRAEAARFSFLLGLPAIAASGLLQLLELVGETGDLPGLAAGIAAAGASGYLAIGFLLRFLERYGTHVFACYRLALGAALLVMNYSWQG